MDADGFDRLTQGFSLSLSRRRFGAVFAVLGFGAGIGAVPNVNAKKKKKKKAKPCANGALRCGTACVDTRTNAQHCGGCGNSCPNGQSCAGGQCVLPVECSSDFDCLGDLLPGDLKCNLQTGRCVCKNAGEGICYRYGGYAGPRAAGECNPCCGDGNGICLRDYVCRNLGTFGGVPYPYCHCPAGTVTCDFGESFRCSQNQATDPRRCGIGCEDCTQRGPTSFCCSGQCLTACEPNTNCNLRTCGGCQTCTGDTACCRSGTSNLFGCALLVNGQCPGPPS